MYTWKCKPTAVVNSVLATARAVEWTGKRQQWYGCCTLPHGPCWTAHIHSAYHQPPSTFRSSVLLPPSTLCICWQTTQSRAHATAQRQQKMRQSKVLFYCMHRTTQPPISVGYTVPAGSICSLPAAIICSHHTTGVWYSVIEPSLWLIQWPGTCYLTLFVIWHVCLTVFGVI